MGPSNCIWRRSADGTATLPGCVCTAVVWSHARAPAFAAVERDRNGAQLILNDQGGQMSQATGTGKYERLLERCKGLAPVPTAVAHPCEETALTGAIEAAQAGLIAPILVGPIK